MRHLAVPLAHYLLADLCDLAMCHRNFFSFFILLSVVTGCAHAASQNDLSDADNGATNCDSIRTNAPKQLRALLSSVKQASRVILLTDHDGTLVPLPDNTHPEYADPNAPDNAWILPTLSMIATRGRDGMQGQAHVITGKAKDAAESFYTLQNPSALTLGIHPEFGTWSRWPESNQWTSHELPDFGWKQIIKPLAGPICARLHDDVRNALRAKNISFQSWEQSDCVIEESDVSVYVVYRPLRTWFLEKLVANKVAPDTIENMRAQFQANAEALRKELQSNIADTGLAQTFVAVHEENNGVMDIIFHRAQKQFITSLILTGNRQYDPNTVPDITESQQQLLDHSVVLAVGDGNADEQMFDAAFKVAQRLEIAGKSMKVFGVRVVRQRDSAPPRWFKAYDKTLATFQIADVDATRRLLIRIAELTRSMPALGAN